MKKGFFKVGLLSIAFVTLAHNFTAAAQAMATQPSIVFASNREGGLKIFAAHRDGGNLKRLTNNTTENKEPAVSPNGRYIVFASTEDANDYNAALVLLDLSTQQETLLTTSKKIDYRNPSWSPDGTRIAFGSIKTEGDYQSCINVMAIANKILQEVVCDDNLVFSPDWSPNGQELLFTELYRPTGGKINTIAAYPGALPKFVDFGSSAVYSPNGSEIAFNAYDANYASQIFVADKYGNSPRQITYGSDHLTVQDWASDGYITFSVFKQSQGALQVDSIKSDGSSRLTIPQKVPGIFDLPGSGLLFN